jgi:hypothetical protein
MSKITGSLRGAAESLASLHLSQPDAHVHAMASAWLANVPPPSGPFPDTVFELVRVMKAFEPYPETPEGMAFNHAMNLVKLACRSASATQRRYAAGGDLRG